MNFDFSALNFETIDSNINAYPDMFLNQNGVTFTKKVLDLAGFHFHSDLNRQWICFPRQEDNRLNLLFISSDK